MINWHNIHSVFLDMDGTLLDLNFDNYFWREYVPQRYAEQHAIKTEQARQILFPRFKAVEGTMDWYCVDYWSRELDLDIALLKQEIDHLIAVHPHVINFLHAVKQHGKRLVLVTNAHMKSLQIKMERTRLHGHFDAVICAHDIGLPKENPVFWQQLQAEEPFTATNTLLVDDSLPVLRSAREYGIRHLLAVYRPDTRGPAKDVEEFNAIESFLDIMPAL